MQQSFLVLFTFQNELYCCDANKVHISSVIHSAGERYCRRQFLFIHKPGDYAV